MRKKTKTELVDELAIAVARVLVKYGSANADYTEWREVKDILLKLHPHLGEQAEKQVGMACSSFNIELQKVLEGA
jgi:hypothetical protein